MCRLSYRSCFFQKLWQVEICTIKGQFTHTMLFPCCAHAVPLPCHAAKGLDSVFPIWFMQCGHVWFTHAMLCPCHATTMPFWKRLLKAMHSTARHGHGMCELTSAVQRRHVGDLPAFCFFGYQAEFREGCYQKHPNPLNWRTDSSDISGYQTDFHGGHGTVGEWQGCGMACVN
jgi:hypothetical protein